MADHKQDDLPNLLIQNGTVVTMDHKLRVLPGGAVVIKGHTIQSVHAAGETLPKAHEVIDASGHLIIPGLVNCHTHVPMILLRGIAEGLDLMTWLHTVIFPAEAKNVNSEFCYWGTLLGCMTMIKSGTSTFADMYYFEDDVARAVDKSGMRAVLGQTIIGFPAPDYKSPEAALIGAEQFIKKWKDHSRVVPSISPHALYTTSLKLVQDASKLCKQYNVPLQLHAQEDRREDEEVKAKLGKAAIAAMDDAGILGRHVILHHVCTASPHDIQILVNRDIGTSHNPKSSMRSGSKPAPVTDFIQCGVDVGLGTDGAANNSNLDMFEEMDMTTKLHRLVQENPLAISALDVFKMATLGGAKALGLSDKIGSIEQGKRADLVLVNVSSPELQPIYDIYSHLVYSLRGANVSTVIVDGRMVMRNRKITTFDENQVAANAVNIQQRVLRSLQK